MTDNKDFIAPAEPWPLLAEWFAEAEKSEINDFNAMSVATVGADGMPSVRILLLKGYDKDGFVFFTNKDSRKGTQLQVAHKAALCFHWKSLKRQIRVEGVTSNVNDAEADTYFATRPRGSQIGAWASQQSQRLEARAVLEQRVHDVEAQYEGKPVPRPRHWGGYRLVPNLIEFWQDRAFRLHDRFVYRRADAKVSWNVERLYP
jgi:pyridoxamine 5'-phosphate oxidase